MRDLAPGQTVHDPSLPGFGARRRTGDAVAYFVLYYTPEGRRRRYTIGQHGAPWTPDTARDKAFEVLSEARVEGADPAAVKRARRTALTIADLCDAYLEDVEAGRFLTRRGAPKKASTLISDRSRISAHIKPLIGTMKVPAVTRQDVEAFMQKIAEGESRARKRTGKKRGLSNVRGGKGASSRTVGLLGAIFTYAIREGLRSDNPVRGVVRHADGRKERRLSEVEYKQLGQGLIAAAVPLDGKSEGIWPAALAAVRFLALTGWRSGEAVSLRWKDLDLPRRTAHLPDTKTGVSTRPLAQTACDILVDLGQGEPDALVFPPSKGKGMMSGFPGFFSRVAGLGQLPKDVTPHVLRHSFASVAADMGYSESTIAALIGHKGMTITSRYVHSADAVLLAAADAVASAINDKMSAGKTGGISPAADDAETLL